MPLTAKSIRGSSTSAAAAGVGAVSMNFQVTPYPNATPLFAASSVSETKTGQAMSMIHARLCIIPRIAAVGAAEANESKQVT